MIFSIASSKALFFPSANIHQVFADQKSSITQSSRTFSSLILLSLASVTSLEIDRCICSGIAPFSLANVPQHQVSKTTESPSLSRLSSFSSRIFISLVTSLDIETLHCLRISFFHHQANVSASSRFRGLKDSYHSKLAYFVVSDTSLRWLS